MSVLLARHEAPRSRSVFFVEVVEEALVEDEEAAVHLAIHPRFLIKPADTLIGRRHRGRRVEARLTTKDRGDTSVTAMEVEERAQIHVHTPSPGGEEEVIGEIGLKALEAAVLVSRPCRT
jgi:hypothetical protein